MRNNDDNNNEHKQAPSFVLDKSSLVEDLNAFAQFLGPEPSVEPIINWVVIVIDSSH